MLPELQNHSRQKRCPLEREDFISAEYKRLSQEIVEGCQCISKLPTFQKGWVSQLLPIQHAWQFQIHRKTHIL